MFSLILIITFCLILSGFFSGSEIALISVNKIKIRHKAKEGSKLAKLIQEMISKSEHLLGTTLVGTNITNVIASVIMTSYMVSKFGVDGEFYAICIMVPLILVLGEIIPKTLYQRKADKICYAIILPLKIFSYLFFPLIFIIQKSVNIIVGVFYPGKNGKNPFVKKDDLQMMVNMDKGSVALKSSEKEMINKIFKFGDITAKEVMTPLVELVAMEINSSINKVILKAKKEGYSRIPIFDGRIYNIVGIVNVFDLLFIDPKSNITISDIMEPVYFIPESKRVDDLLKNLQQSSIHITIVVNEYGGSIGLITVEDILEEIVGEIEDEFDHDEKLFEKLEGNNFIIDARMEIDAIREQLNLDFLKGDYETLAGLILEKIEKIPKKGEVIRSNNFIFTIEDVNEKRIMKVRVTKEADL